MPPALQHAEYKLLCQAIQEAAQLLAEGKVALGYQCLNSGLERAVELSEAGETWAVDLAESYRRALFHYACLYPTSQRVPMTQVARRL